MPAITTIKLRRDTAANWTSANPVLISGEPGLETDTGKLKFGDSSTAWNSLPYASGGGGAWGTITGTLGDQTDLQAALDSLRAGLPHAGTATLASGSATVAADWITADSIIVVTPQTDGTGRLRANAADIVDGVSFDIKSSDGSDSRVVSWMTSQPTGGIYFTWRVKFDADEVTDGSSAGSADMLDVHQDAGADDTNAILFTFLEWPSGTPPNVIIFGTWSTNQTHSLTVVADTYYVFGAKIRLLNGGADGYEVTPYVDGVEQAPFTDPTPRTGIGSFDFGGRYAPASDNVKRSYDYLKVGTTGWGSSDLFDANFSSAIVPPFDSEVSGGNLSIVTGNMLVDVPGGGTDAYAIKDL